MESLDILILSVEAAVGLAGFSGIIATFRFSDGKDVSRADAVGLSIVVHYSLLAALGSAIPLGLFSLKLGEETIWAISSVTGAMLIVIGLYSVHKSLKGIQSNKNLRAQYWLGFTVSTCFVVFYILNILGVIFNREPGPVILAQIWFLTFAGFMFSRLLLLPVWRNVHKQEVTRLADTT